MASIYTEFDKFPRLMLNGFDKWLQTPTVSSGYNNNNMKEKKVWNSVVVIYKISSLKLENRRRIWTPWPIGEVSISHRVARCRHPLLNNPKCLSETGFCVSGSKNVNRSNTDENINGEKYAWCVTFVILRIFMLLYTIVETVSQ